MFALLIVMDAYDIKLINEHVCMCIVCQQSDCVVMQQSRENVRKLRRFHALECIAQVHVLLFVHH